MKSIASLVVVAVVVACAMSMAPQSSMSKGGAPHVDSAGTYEHLATAIIAIRETEESFVHGMLSGYALAARTDLEAAAGMSGTDRGRALETAATAITNLASEGDKSVQAVRQRLLKAGHHHHTDAETKEDYLFIDSKEKSQLLALAGDVAKMSRGSAKDIRGAADRLDGIVATALRPE